MRVGKVKLFGSWKMIEMLKYRSVGSITSQLGVLE